GNMLFRAPVDLRNETHIFIQQMGEKYGGISGAKAGPFSFVFLSDPDYIEHMFLNRDIYIKINEGGNLKYLLGNGLLTSEGEFWLKQRRLMQPLFHKQRLSGFVQKIADATNEMMTGWESTGLNNLNFYREMNQVTLDIVGQTLLSTNLKGDFAKVNRALTAVLEAVNRKRGKMFRIPQWVPLPSQIRLNRNRKVLEDTISEIIEKRKADKNHFDDLLSMLIEVEDADTKERMSDKQLRDEVLTIFLAGHETTANALAFTFYLLAKHPEIKKRVQQEIETVLKGAELNYELLGKLEYTTMVIKESLRLYPPAWVTVREAAKEDVIDGYQVNFNDKIVVSPYAVQRSEKYWQDPDKFDPQRFSPEKIKSIPRFAYFPFGGGARLCIGNNFAMMEMQLVLALVCSKYDFTLPADFKLEIRPFITLRPKDGIPLQLVKR
ncbi:MAG: cytochrome, partial [Bacteroidota bacterium]|nr:cytochrome [Bacteroidota bacterium]